MQEERCGGVRCRAGRLRIGQIATDVMDVENVAYQRHRSRRPVRLLDKARGLKNAAQDLVRQQAVAAFVQMAAPVDVERFWNIGKDARQVEELHALLAQTLAKLRQLWIRLAHHPCRAARPERGGQFFGGKRLGVRQVLVGLQEVVVRRAVALGQTGQQECAPMPVVACDLGPAQTIHACAGVGATTPFRLIADQRQLPIEMPLAGLLDSLQFKASDQAEDRAAIHQSPPRADSQQVLAPVVETQDACADGQLFAASAAHQWPPIVRRTRRKRLGQRDVGLL